MNCEHVKELVDAVGSETALESTNEELRAHLLVCPSCNSAWRLQQSILRTLEKEQPPLLSADFTERVMAQLPQEQDYARLLSRFAPTVAVIAVVALALALSFKSRAGERGVIEVCVNFVQHLSQVIIAALQPGFVKIRQTVLQSFGEQVFRQGWQVAVISAVTYVVSRLAVAIEGQLKRMTKGF